MGLGYPWARGLTVGGGGFAPSADRVGRNPGAFHPFNLLFAPDGGLALLGASRGCAGDAADDVTALAINYVFFAVDRPGAWQAGLGAMWHRLWTRYIGASGDAAVLDVAAPWLAWRALVITNPRWYPGLSAAGRDALLGWIDEVFAENADEAARFIGGERRLQGVLIGLAMKKSGGRADPKKLSQLIGARAGK